jgi:hypothetical protein
MNRKEKGQKNPLSRLGIEGIWCRDMQNGVDINPMRLKKFRFWCFVVKIVCFCDKILCKISIQPIENNTLETAKKCGRVFCKGRDRQSFTG